jgi:hypothetical protein
MAVAYDVKRLGEQWAGPGAVQTAMLFGVACMCGDDIATRVRFACFAHRNLKEFQTPLLSILNLSDGRRAVKRLQID